jgi:hypothetical protein
MLARIALMAGTAHFSDSARMMWRQCLPFSTLT